MSLIQDALKRKREENAVIPPQETTPPPAAKPEPQLPKDKPKSPSDKLILFLVLFIVLTLISIGAMKFFRSPSEATTSTINVKSTVDPSEAESTVDVKSTVDPSEGTVKAPAPIAKVIKKIRNVKWPKLELTGFVASGGQRRVFINGKMLAEGREVEGARIVQIGKTEVLVEYQGERHILRVDDD